MSSFIWYLAPNKVVEQELPLLFLPFPFSFNENMKLPRCRRILLPGNGRRCKGGHLTFRSGRGPAPPGRSRWSSNVFRTAVGSGSQGPPFGDGSPIAGPGAKKAFFTAESRTEPRAKDRYAVNGSHAVCGGATELENYDFGWSLGYDIVTGDRYLEARGLSISLEGNFFLV